MEQDRVKFFSQFGLNFAKLYQSAYTTLSHSEKPNSLCTASLLLTTLKHNWRFFLSLSPKPHALHLIPPIMIHIIYHVKLQMSTYNTDTS